MSEVITRYCVLKQETPQPLQWQATGHFTNIKEPEQPQEIGYFGGVTEICNVEGYGRVYTTFGLELQLIKYND